MYLPEVRAKRGDKMHRMAEHLLLLLQIYSIKMLGFAAAFGQDMFTRLHREEKEVDVDLEKKKAINEKLEIETQLVDGFRLPVFDSDCERSDRYCNSFYVLLTD
jgi:hypothetical protein